MYGGVVSGLMLLPWDKIAREVLAELAIFMGCILALRLGRSLVNRLLTVKVGGVPTPRLHTIASLANGAVVAIVWFLGIAWMLDVVGFNLAPVLASAGVASLALAFGAQTLAKDLVTGIFLVVEDQFQVGELVEMAGVRGRIETIGLRVTQLRDDTGRLITLPNSTITQVVNYSRGSFTVSYDVKIDYAKNPDDVGRILEKLAAALHDDTPGVLEGPTLKGLVGVGDGKQTLRIMTRVEPGRREVLENALRLRIKQALDEAGIAWL